ncbi:MAG: TolC family protein [Daejeonella sp.]
MNRYKLILLCILFSPPLLAQDNKRTLSAEQVMQIVRQYHPVAKQASILIEKAKADITIARGGFDPLFYNGRAQKTFDGTEYYQYNRPELTIPTWFGMEVYAGLEKLSGSRTDPTETSGQTSYFGISVPLAKNLLMDKRRAALQTAKILRSASEVEQRNILNNLLLDAMKSYWNWVQQYQSYKTLTDAGLVNEKRVQLVKTAFLLGDRPAIDTTEVLTQLQNFQVLRENASMKFQNAGLELSVFLWQQNEAPAVLPVDVIPADEPSLLAVSGSSLPALNELLNAAEKNHPELLLYDFKLDALAVEKKLKFQDMLPSVKFQYNQLAKGFDILETTGPLFENNFQYGLSIAIPLRLSEGRGEYRKTKLKITETQLQQNLKQVQLENKVKSYFNELAALKKQVQVQESAFKNYLALQRGEEIRFQTGESSLFMVNSRENKTLEALQKLQELRIKYLVTGNTLQWAAGLIIE